MTKKELFGILQSCREGNCPVPVLMDALSEYGIDPDEKRDWKHTGKKYSIRQYFNPKARKRTKTEGYLRLVSLITTEAVARGEYKPPYENSIYR